MEHYKLNFKRLFLFLILIAAFLFTSCNKIINILNTFGIIPPQEQRLEFQLEKQVFDKPFTFADYCKERYDSIFLVYPYFNIEKKDFKNIRMSCRLKDICESNALSDSYSTILFINRGIVKAYSIIATANAGFNAREVEKHYIFPIDQKFIMDKERNIHIHNE